MVQQWLVSELPALSKELYLRTYGKGKGKGGNSTIDPTRAIVTIVHTPYHNRWARTLLLTLLGPQSPFWGQTTWNLAGLSPHMGLRF